jgi:hypothetical protein
MLRMTQLNPELADDSKAYPHMPAQFVGSDTVGETTINQIGV